jgi:hypothetical protein
VLTVRKAQNIVFGSAASGKRDTRCSTLAETISLYGGAKGRCDKYRAKHERRHRYSLMAVNRRVTDLTVDSLKLGNYVHSDYPLVEAISPKSAGI